MAEDKTAEPGSEEQKVDREELEARLAGREAESKDEKPPEKDGEIKKGDKKTPEPEKQDEPDPEVEKIVSQADNPDAVRNAIKRHQETAKEQRERADTLAAEVEKYKDQERTDHEKLENRANTAETRATDAESKLERIEVAIKTGLPLDLAHRLRGDDRAELEADAMQLLEVVKPSTPTGDPDAGKGSAKKEEDFTATLRKQAGVTAS